MSQNVECCRPEPKPLTDEEVERIARVCHEANRGYCESIGDDAQTCWVAELDDVRQSVRDGVLFVAGQRNQYVAAEAVHDNWMTCKLRNGWRWGETKNATKKEHPCLLPWSALPDAHKAKDVLFVAVVRALTANT